LKMFSLPPLTLKYSNKIFVWYLGILYGIHVLVPRRRLSYHQFYPLLRHEHSEQYFTPVIS
jgi:hypothetical protein